MNVTLVNVSAIKLFLTCKDNLMKSVFDVLPAGRYL